MCAGHREADECEIFAAVVDGTLVTPTFLDKVRAVTTDLHLHLIAVFDFAVFDFGQPIRTPRSDTAEGSGRWQAAATVADVHSSPCVHTAFHSFIPD